MTDIAALHELLLACLHNEEYKVLVHFDIMQSVFWSFETHLELLSNILENVNNSAYAPGFLSFPPLLGECGMGSI